MSFKSITYILLIFCLAGWRAECTAQAGLHRGDSVRGGDGGGGGQRVIDSAMAFSPSYMPVASARVHPVEFTPLHYVHIDTPAIHTAHFTPLLDPHNLYQSLGINGQAHRNMVFDYDHGMGFSLITLPYPLYFKGSDDLCLYELKSPFTQLSYIYGLPNENIFSAVHAQQVGRFAVAANIRGISNPGYFIHQGTNTLNLDVLLHYQTGKNVYGFTAGYIFNHLKLSENGGLSDYRSFTNRSGKSVTSDLGSFNVLFSNAKSTVNGHDFFFRQYVNIRDRRGRHFGAVTHTFQFHGLKDIFTDHDLNNTFYQNQYYISTDSTCDTISLHTIANSLQWSNFDPTVRETDKAYDFKFAGGLRHEYVRTRIPRYVGHNFSLFARTNIRLFRVWDIAGSISYTFSKGYNNNDAVARARATFAINRSSRHFIGLGADFYRVAPDYFLSYHISNYRIWNFEWPKENNLKLHLFWTWRDYKVSCGYFMMDNHVYLDATLRPAMYSHPVSLIQLAAYAPVRTRNFYMDANAVLQHSTRKDIISVPLFAGKLSAGCRFRLFKDKLRLQFGADLFYNTLYHADAYNPLMHQFYRQETVQTGNYVYLDLCLTMQVERLAFFFRGGNLLAGLPSYRYFTTPHYPMQGRHFQLGIVWRFYD